MTLADRNRPEIVSGTFTKSYFLILIPSATGQVHVMATR